MRTEDLKVFYELGCALWSDADYSKQVAAEIFTANSLLDLTPDRQLERAASALLRRALKEGIAGNSFANLKAINRSFFRLTPKERFLLVALHQGRWSYARLSRILGVQPEEIEEQAWSARVSLASGGAVKYPAGAGAKGRSCPEYDPSAPWTQRFLDEEIQTGQERLFLQNHLMACDSCRETLNRCRDFYYAVDGLLPGASDAERFSRYLARLYDQGRSLKLDQPITFSRSLMALLRKRDVQIALGIGAISLVLAIWKGHH